VNLKCVGMALMAWLACSQTQTSPLKFEITSVRPNNSPDPDKALVQFLPGGRFVSTNVPLIKVVAAAWGLALQSQRLILASGVKMPDEVYDIEATPEKGAFPPGITTEDRVVKMRLMVQALLEDRFQLIVRRDSKEQPVYVLVVARGGPKLEKSKFQEPNCNEEIGPKLMSNPACHWLDGGQDGGLHGGSVTIASVVEELQNYTDRPLLDKTGLTDFYNIQTEGWAPMRATMPSPNPAQQSDDLSANISGRPPLSQVFEKLGLRMESQRAVVEMFVIDHVEKPGEN
jgi:bla regulator protein blaR1